MCVVYYLITIYQVTSVTLCTQSLKKKKIVKGDMYRVQEKKAGQPCSHILHFFENLNSTCGVKQKISRSRGFQ